MVETQQPKMPPRVYQMSLCGYNCQWSPFDATKIAVAQSQNYGLVGTGGVAILDVSIAQKVSNFVLGQPNGSISVPAISDA